MLFDDNLGFFGFSIPKEVNFKKSDDLVSVEKGFIRGNMFSNLFDNYKDYKVNAPVASTNRESELLDIMALSFSLNDLNLYLDLHPTDEVILKKFCELVDISCKKEMEYVKKYGPILVDDSVLGDKFNWVDNPWPWSVEDSKYV